MRLWLAVLLSLGAATAGAGQSVHGLLDARYAWTDSITSYLDGGYGKFRFGDGQQLALAQLGVSYRGDLSDAISAHVVANGYADGVHNSVGLTEAYLRYRSLPSAEGLRVQLAGGLMYPRVSLENVQTAWSSPYSLEYSTANAWIAEEVRHLGAEWRVTRLGKFRGANYDMDLAVALFRGNDPAGAMLAWHGWVSSGRQSLHRETLPLPNSDIGFVPGESDPFRELDNRTGYHLSAQWDWHDHGRALAGYYDNKADPAVVKHLQWAWRTRFAHLGAKWLLPADTELLAQYLRGDTLMRSATSGADLVFNDFSNAFLMLSRNIGSHRVSARAEWFEVGDRDDMTFDDNEERGRALTLAWRYRISAPVYLHLEYNRVHSKRPSRARYGLPRSLGEDQLQVGVRYYFY